MIQKMKRVMYKVESWLKLSTFDFGVKRVSGDKIKVVCKSFFVEMVVTIEDVTVVVDVEVVVIVVVLVK